MSDPLSHRRRKLLAPVPFAAALVIEVAELASPVECRGGGVVDAAFGYGAPALFLVVLIAWTVFRPKGVGFVMTVSAAAIVLLFLVALLRFGKCIS